MSSGSTLMGSNLQFAAEQLQTARSAAAQEGLEFLVYLIEMALTEAEDHLRHRSGVEVNKVVDLRRD